MDHFSCEQKIVLVKIDAISQRPYFVVTKINKPKRISSGKFRQFCQPVSSEFNTKRWLLKIINTSYL